MAGRRTGTNHQKEEDRAMRKKKETGKKEKKRNRSRRKQRLTTDNHFLSPESEAKAAEGVRGPRTTESARG